MTVLDGISLSALIEHFADRVASRVAEELRAGAPQPSTGELVTLAAAARARNLSLRTLRRGLGSGLAHVGKGRLVRVALLDVDRWLSRGHGQTTDDIATAMLLRGRGGRP